MMLESDLAMRNASRSVENTAEFKKAQHQMLISNRTLAGQIFEYYSAPKIDLI